MRSTFLYWYLLRGFIKMNWTRRENILVESLFDLFRFYYYFLWFLIFSSLLRTILFYSIFVETEFCSSSILFLGRVIYRGYVDINFLYFLYSVYRVGRDIRNYFHIFIYIFIQFGNIGERNGVKMKFLSYFEKSYLMWIDIFIFLLSSLVNWTRKKESSSLIRQSQSS